MDGCERDEGVEQDEAECGVDVDGPPAADGWRLCAQREAIGGLVDRQGWC